MKKSVIIFVLFFLSFAGQAKAGVYISEIMYDYEGTDTDYEWVELANDSGSDISISGWKFNDGSNHNLNTPPTNGSTGSLVVPANGFLILASNASSFNSLYNLSESVIDTVMSMNNTTETISILDSNSSTIDSVSFSSSDGANGDGNSLQLVSGSWVSGSPTPGDENSGSSSGSSNTDDEDEIVSSGLSTEDEAQIADFEALPYKTEIIVPDIIMAGDTVDFRAYTTKEDGSVTHTGTFIWNMGDGNLYNLKTDVLEHVFEYPGTYKVNLSYFRKGQNKNPEAEDSIILNVASPTLEVKSISSDGAVTIFNNSSNVLSIDGWSLVSDGFAFYFPFGSNVLGKGELTLSKKITKFPYVPNNIEIRSSGGAVIDRYPDKVVLTQNSSNLFSRSASTKKVELLETPSSSASTTDNLLANTISSGGKNNSLLILGILFVVLGLGFYFYESGFVVFKNFFGNNTQNKKASSLDDEDNLDLLNVDDFTIVQEESKR